jgi:hypothetical protein
VIRVFIKEVRRNEHKAAVKYTLPELRGNEPGHSVGTDEGDRKMGHATDRSRLKL